MTSITTPMQLVLELSSLHTHFLKQLEHQLSMHGISFTELLVMHQLSGAANQTMRRIELANSIGLSASGVTRLLKPMEKIGLVEKQRNPRDARVSLVRLSKIGGTLYRDAFTSCSHSAELLSSPLTKKQLSTLLDLIAALK